MLARAKSRIDSSRLYMPMATPAAGKSNTSSSIRSPFSPSDHAQLAGTGHPEVGRLILVAERVTADDDRVGPARNETRDVVDHDRLAEDDTAQDVADCAVGGAPHLLETEFLDPCLVGRDGRAFEIGRASGGERGGQKG